MVLKPRFRPNFPALMGCDSLGRGGNLGLMALSVVALSVQKAGGGEVWIA